MRRARIVPVTALALALAGCAASPPAGVSAELTQARTQYAERELTVLLKTTGDAVTVTAATLRAEGFEDGTASGVAVEVTPDRPRGVGLALPLGEAVCAPGDGAAGDPVPRAATVVLTHAGGSVELPAPDPLGRLGSVHQEDCAAAAVASAASLTVADEVEDLGDGTGLLRLRVDPVPGGPSLTLTEIRPTTLFSRGDGPAGGSSWTELEGRAIPLRIAPARCDAHVVAEDKRGTFLPVSASVDGVPQAPVPVAMSSAGRTALFAFLAAACDTGGR